jgi:hypothetical protein
MVSIFLLQPHSMMFPGIHPAAMMSMPGMAHPNSNSGGHAAYPPQPLPHHHMAAAAAVQGSNANGAAAVAAAAASHQQLNGGRPHVGAGGQPFFNGANGGGGGHRPRYDVVVNPFQAQSPQTAQETSYLYIPNSSVGAIIGPKGNNIRYIMKFSGASVKIAQPESTTPAVADDAQQQLQPTLQPTESPSAPPPAPIVGMDANIRRVTIVGTPEAQWKAQYLIFEKMSEEEYRYVAAVYQLSVLDIQIQRFRLPMQKLSKKKY